MSMSLPQKVIMVSFNEYYGRYYFPVLNILVCSFTNLFDRKKGRAVIGKNVVYTLLLFVLRQ